eukprot:GFYU01073900.1.p1 GENE.GFYU01073900.1~~GFYU01073900.1.p1  ORF type:complete len:122 (-),score=8.01 GFYU01073900.1:155-466(-)
MANGGSDSANLISLVEKCSDLDDLDPCGSVAISFIYPYLFRCVKQGKHEDIVKTLLMFLKHPLLPEKRMLCLLHLLRQLSLVSSPRVQRLTPKRSIHGSGVVC